MARIQQRPGDLPKRSLWQRVKAAAALDVGVLARGGGSPGSLEQLETMLLESDFGVPVTLRLVAEVEARAKRGELVTDERVPRGARRRRSSARCARGRAIRALARRAGGRRR